MKKNNNERIIVSSIFLIMKKNIKGIFYTDRSYRKSS